MNYKGLAGTIILSVLICAGIFVYSQWDYQRFVGELEKLPEVSPEPVAKRSILFKERPEYPSPVVMVETKRLEGQILESKDHEMEAEVLSLEALDSLMAELESDLDELSLSEVELPEALAVDPVESIDFAKVKEAWGDYNDLLATGEERAYERLAEGFREMYGDYPEVDTIVETIKRANNQTLTIDDAIAMNKAFLRIMPDNQFETIEMLEERLTFLQEAKELEAEFGEPPEIIYHVSVGE